MLSIRLIYFYIAQIRNVLKVTWSWTFFQPYFSNANIIREHEKFSHFSEVGTIAEWESFLILQWYLH